MIVIQLRLLVRLLVKNFSFSGETVLHLSSSGCIMPIGNKEDRFLEVTKILNLYSGVVGNRKPWNKE